MNAIDESLAPLFARAEAEGLWFHCAYQDLWFSPARLKVLQASGSYRWGAVNWTLRPPSERLAEAESRVQNAIAERDRIAQELQ